MKHWSISFITLLLTCFALTATAGPDAAPPQVSDYFYDAQPATMADSNTRSKKSNGAEVRAEPAPEITPPMLVETRINNELWYVLMLGGLCLSSLGIVMYFLHARDSGARDMVNAAGIILIIFGTIILVLVVTTSEQLTAAIGVLGAIAGYLLRSGEGDSKKPSKPDTAPPG